MRELVSVEHASRGTAVWADIEIEIEMDILMLDIHGQCIDSGQRRMKKHTQMGIMGSGIGY